MEGVVLLFCRSGEGMHSPRHQYLSIIDHNIASEVSPSSIDFVSLSTPVPQLNCYECRVEALSTAFSGLASHC